MFDVIAESVGIPYGTSSAAPGSIFYAPSVSVSSAHSAAAAIGYPPPPGSLYSYPPGLSSSSRPQYSNQAPVVSKDDGLSAQKHHAAIYLGHGSSSQMPSRPSMCKFFLTEILIGCELTNYFFGQQSRFPWQIMCPEVLERR